MMSLDRLINILVTITLIEMMVLIGLRVTFAELVETIKNWRLVARLRARWPRMAGHRGLRRTIGLDIQVFKASTSREINMAFATFVRERPDALFVDIDPFFTSRVSNWSTWRRIID
jgi:hypothetical protein